MLLDFQHNIFSAAVVNNAGSSFDASTFIRPGLVTVLCVSCVTGIPPHFIWR